MAKKRLKDRPRYASGRAKPLSKAAAEAVRMQTVLKHRQQHFMRYLAAPGEPATDRRYGSIIGRLSLQGVISLTQFDAAERYGEIRSEHLQIKTEQKPTESCQLAAMVFGTGRSTAPEMSTRTAEAKTDYHDGMMTKLKDIDAIGDLNAKHFKIEELLDRVTVYDREIALTPANVAALRTALNILARYFQFVR
jgi:hypothetical protein